MHAAEAAKDRLDREAAGVSDRYGAQSERKRMGGLQR